MDIVYISMSKYLVFDWKAIGSNDNLCIEFIENQWSVT